MPHNETTSNGKSKAYPAITLAFTFVLHNFHPQGVNFITNEWPWPTLKDEDE